jgi:hypothetical protein
MIYEPDLGGMRNFGFALHEVLLDQKQHRDWEEDENHLFFPRGSFIADSSVFYALEQGLKPVFVGCGWVGDPLDPTLMQEALFVGCRGPKTQEELAICGIDVPVTHDPIYELPKLFPASEPNGLAMGVIHIDDDMDYSQTDMFDLKSDTLDTPLVKGQKDIFRLIERISGSRFVLSGSMSVAMVAHAYGIPFAPLDSGYIHCEPKWEDWFDAENFGPLTFASDVIEGREWYNKMTREKDGSNNE